MQADDLNINAANALLKSLEEPPTRALFLLVSSEPSRLLPTIRSRSRRLDLSPLAPEPLKRAVSAALAAADQEMPSDKDWARLERLAKGSVRRALQLAASGGLELHERIEAMLKGLPKVDWPAAHALSDQLARRRQRAALRGVLRPAARHAGAAGVGAGDGAGRGGGAGAGRAADPGAPAGRPGRRCGSSSCATRTRRRSSTSTARR